MHAVAGERQRGVNSPHATSTLCEYYVVLSSRISEYLWQYYYYRVRPARSVSVCAWCGARRQQLFLKWCPLRLGRGVCERAQREPDPERLF